jgi:hypothetical protein
VTLIASFITGSLLSLLLPVALLIALVVWYMMVLRQVPEPVVGEEPGASPASSEPGASPASSEPGASPTSQAGVSHTSPASTGETAGSPPGERL